jgi:AAA family ATP:ADP antiporter
VGAQSGKSVSSVLQQVLLILTGGTVGGILPVLAVFYAVMLHRWNTSVADLAEHYDPSRIHRESILGSMDESDAEDTPGGAPSGGPAPALPAPAGV